MTLEHPTPPKGTTQGKVIDLNEARIQDFFDLGIIHRVPVGGDITISPSSSYIVRAGCVQLVKNVTTVSANRNAVVREYGPGRLFNASGLIGKGEQLPGTSYRATKPTTILEFTRDRIKDRPRLHAVLISLVASLAKQALDDEREICGMVTDRTKKQTQVEADLEARLQTAETSLTDMIGKMTASELELQNATNQRESAQRTIDNLHKQIEIIRSSHARSAAEQHRKVRKLESDLVAARAETAQTQAHAQEVNDLRKQIDDLMSAAAEKDRKIQELERELATDPYAEARQARTQMREAVLAFEENRQQTSNLWQCFEEYMHNLGVDKLPPKMCELLLGFGPEEVDNAVEDAFEDTLVTKRADVLPEAFVYTLEQEPVMDITELVVSDDGVDASNPVNAVEPGFTDVKHLPTPSADGATTEPELEPEVRSERTTMLGIAPVSATAAHPHLSAAEVRKALEAPNLFDPAEDAEADAKTREARKSARGSAGLPPPPPAEQRSTRIRTLALGIDPAAVRAAAAREAAKAAQAAAPIEDDDEYVSILPQDRLDAARAADAQQTPQTKAYEGPRSKR